MTSYTQARETFSSLLHWHLINGTRPLDNKKVGNEWTNQEFAGAVRIGITDKAIRNWRSGRNLPTRTIDHIERALFGDAPTGQRAIWREELRAAYTIALHKATETAVNGAILVDAAVAQSSNRNRFKPGAGKTEWFKDVESGPEMVVVPAGSFTMGSNYHDSEEPLHQVTISKPFAVGRFPITFAEWDAAGLSYKPDDHGWGRGQRPVINVYWYDAQDYVEWLSRLSDKAYRLLTEAEWEYCCRAGTTTKYAFGDALLHSQARFKAEQTVEVGKFPSNGWGLYDMLGNVSEWCEDVLHDNYNGAPTDGSAWLRGGDNSYRVLRGGSWGSHPVNLRSANRFGDKAGSRDGGYGFRVARTLIY